MKLSPLDIKKQEFARTLRGIDADEVQAFLDMLAGQWEDMLAQQRRTEDRVHELKAKMEHYERVEEALQEALRTARQSSQQALENAKQEADLIIRKATAQGDDITRGAAKRRDQLELEVGELLGRRDEIVARLRAFLMSEAELLARFDGRGLGSLAPRESETPAPKKNERKARDEDEAEAAAEDAAEIVAAAYERAEESEAASLVETPESLWSELDAITHEELPDEKIPDEIALRAQAFGDQALEDIVVAVAEEERDFEEDAFPAEALEAEPVIRAVWDEVLMPEEASDAESAVEAILDEEPSLPEVPEEEKVTPFVEAAEEEIVEEEEVAPVADEILEPVAEEVLEADAFLEEEPVTEMFSEDEPVALEILDEAAEALAGPEIEVEVMEQTTGPEIEVEVIGAEEPLAEAEPESLAGREPELLSFFKENVPESFAGEESPAGFKFFESGEGEPAKAAKFARGGEAPARFAPSEESSRKRARAPIRPEERSPADGNWVVRPVSVSQGSGEDPLSDDSPVALSDEIEKIRRILSDLD